MSLTPLFMMRSFVLVVLLDCALWAVPTYTTLGEVKVPQVESFVFPNNIDLRLLIRRSEVVRLLSCLIDLLPTRPPKVDHLFILRV